VTNLKEGDRVTVQFTETVHLDHHGRAYVRAGWDYPLYLNRPGIEYELERIILPSSIGAIIRVDPTGLGWEDYVLTGDGKWTSLQEPRYHQSTTEEMDRLVNEVLPRNRYKVLSKGHV
jgi:hypothetical protein